MRISDWSSDVCSSDLQEGEHVDEVEIEVQRPHHHRLAHEVGAADHEINALDLLRIIGGQAGEQQYADDADRQAERARLHEHVDDHRDEDADDAHDQEGAEARQVLLGRIAVEAEARSEEHTSELQSLMRISYAVFCLKKKKNQE